MARPAGPGPRIQHRGEPPARPDWPLRRSWLRFVARTPEPLPVVLDRRRVYVLPSGFGLFFSALLLTMLIGALNYNNNPALLLALLLACTGLASLIATHLQLSGLRLDSIAAEPVPAGEPLRLRVALAAVDTRRRLGLHLGVQDQDSLVPTLQGRSVVAELALPTTTRGWMQAGRLRLSTTQPLGLARTWAWLRPDAPLLVHPRPENDGPPLPDPAGASRTTRATLAGEEPHHLRDYRPGDPPRTVAWKPSARRGSLLVREYEQPQGSQVDLAWDTLAGLAYEARIARLAHWVDLAQRQSRRTLLRLPGQAPIGPGLGPDHRSACLRALALLPVQEGP